jgi:transcriptional antiterminator NusG
MSEEIKDKENNKELEVGETTDNDNKNTANNNNAEKSEAQPTNETADLNKDIREKLVKQFEGKFGSWYVVRVTGGKENEAKAELEARIKYLNMDDSIYEVLIPIGDTVSIRKGKKVLLSRNAMSGYMFIRMNMDGDSYAAVTQTQSIFGFVGHTKTPVPVTIEEMVNMLIPVEISKITAPKEVEENKIKEKEASEFKIGDAVEILDGPLAGMPATVSEINKATKTAKVLATLFGRETALDYSINKLEKVKY